MLLKNERGILPFGGATVARRAAWYYPSPNGRYAALQGHVALYPGAMDYCLVDGTEHINITYDHIAIQLVRNALDPAHAWTPNCLT